MKKVVCVIIGVACFVAAGCQTTAPETGTDAAVTKPASTSTAIGQAAQSLIDAAGEQKVQIFDETGTEVAKLPKLPPEKTGSVSIHAADGAGQDNYTFDEKHCITKHMRSYGEDYAAGKWEEVK